MQLSSKPLLRKDNRRRKNRINLPVLICFLFLSIWGIGMWFLSSSLQTTSTTTIISSNNANAKASSPILQQQRQQQMKDSSSSNNNGNVKASSPILQQQRQQMKDSSSAHHHQQQHQQKLDVASPWYGWQPLPLENDNNSISCPLKECLLGKGRFQDHSKCRNCLDDPNDMMNDDIPADDPGPDWIPDATMLHSMMLNGKDRNGNIWPPILSKSWCQPMGVFGGPNDDNKKLLDGVPIRGTPHHHSLDDTDASASAAAKGGDHSSSPRPTIFCGVYTMKENHAGNIRAMRETWAPYCNGFVAFSTGTDPRIPALNIHHEGAEEYNNMWQKSRSIWRYIGSHYLNDFDYFILGGEDLLIIPDNLRAYLQHVQETSTPQSTTPEDDLFAGRRFKGYGLDNYFNSGGAGYVLSRGTLRKLYETGLDHPDCNPHRHTAMEDVMIAECLRKVFSIGLTDTRDDQGRERFHPFAPGLHLTWRHPLPGAHDWYEDYNAEWGIKTGLDCCAPDSVSFHYIKKPATVRHLWSLLYHCD